MASSRLVCEDFDVVLNTVPCARRPPRYSLKKILEPLTETIPVTLLPVCNRPILLYQLDLIIKAQFTRVILVVSSSERKLVESCVAAYLAAEKVDMEVIYVDISANTLGDAVVLQEISHRDHLIKKKNFFFIGCDTVVGDVLQAAADVHRIQGSVVTLSLKEKASPEPAKVEQKNKKQTTVKKRYKTKDFFGLLRQGGAWRIRKKGQQDVSRVVFSATVESLGKEDPVVEIPKALLASHPRLTLYSDLEDMHVYLFSSWVLDLLSHNTHFRTISEDLLPFLVKRDSRTVSDAFPLLKQPLLQRVSSVASSKSATSTASKNGEDLLEITCKTFAVIHPLEEGAFCGRVGKIEEYLDLNRALKISSSDASSSTPWKTVESGIGRGKIVVGGVDLDKKAASNMRKALKDSVVIRTSVPSVGEKTKIINCVIGKGVKVGASVKLNNCVLMDGVTVCDNCTIQNTVLCREVRVKERCNLKDCEIGEKFAVPEGSRINGESRSSCVANSLVDASPVLTGALGD